jgi:hypothetical protein
MYKSQEKIRFDTTITTIDDRIIQDHQFLSPLEVKMGRLREFLEFVLVSLRVKHITLYQAGKLIASKDYDPNRSGQRHKNSMIYLTKNLISRSILVRIRPMQNVIDILHRQMMDFRNHGIMKPYFVIHPTDEKSDNG